MSDRKCSQCNGEGPFPLLGNQCKACKAQKQAVWYQKNKELLREKQRERQRIPEKKGERQVYVQNHRKQEVEKVQRWKLRHPEQSKALAEEQHRKQKESGYAAESARKRYHANIEKSRAYGRNYWHERKLKENSDTNKD